MSRRRLILAACVAVVALGADWWFSIDRLSPEEQRLVGTWRLKSDLAHDFCAWVFKADRRCEWAGNPAAMTAGDGSLVTMAWSARAGEIVIEYEPSYFRRMLRRLLARIGVKTKPAETITVEFITGDEFVVTGAGGNWNVWTRVRGD